MFFVSFGILVFCRSLIENNSFKVKRKHTLRRLRWCGYVQPNQGDDLIEISLIGVKIGLD
jgi:hypothetical protein